jgi:hypothetical protein
MKHISNLGQSQFVKPEIWRLDIVKRGEIYELAAGAGCFNWLLKMALFCGARSLVCPQLTL